MNATAPKRKNFMRAYGLEDDKDERDWQADRVRPVSLPSGRQPLLNRITSELPVIWAQSQETFKTTPCRTRPSALRLEKA
jgi:hypothetical protein